MASQFIPGLLALEVEVLAMLEASRRMKRKPPPDDRREGRREDGKRRVNPRGSVFGAAAAIRQLGSNTVLGIGVEVSEGHNPDIPKVRPKPPSGNQQSNRSGWIQYYLLLCKYFNDKAACQAHKALTQQNSNSGGGGGGGF